MVPITTQQNIGTVTMAYTREFGSSGDESESQAAVRDSQTDVVQK
jgi:hypothetical protein